MKELPSDMRIIPLVLLLCLFAASCKVKKTSGQANTPAIDSILQQHLERIESLPYYDTSNYDYQVLKAYYHQDLPFLKQLSAEIAFDRQKQSIQEYMDTCVHLPELTTIPVQEAYRFIYMQAFSPNKINITISKQADSVHLHFILFKPRWEKEPCSIIKEYDKKLTLAQWNEFTEAMEYADFWGMKKDNGIHGVDGSSLLVYGYKKANPQYEEPARSHSIYRWSSNTMAIYSPLSVLLELSGNMGSGLWGQ